MRRLAIAMACCAVLCVGGPVLSNVRKLTPQDIWSRDLKQAVYERFYFFAKGAFRHSDSLSAKVTFDVSPDGTVSNVELGKPASNALFNKLAMQSVKSLSAQGPAVLRHGMKRTQIHDAITFEWRKRGRFENIYAGPYDEVEEYIEQRNAAAKQRD